MAPRAYWKGYLRLSLVSCPIAMHPASSEREKIRFHQLNRETGNRVRYRKVDEGTGDEVPNDEIIKGYEVSKGEYVELTPEELEAAAIDSTRMIDIFEFVPEKEIDELYVNAPYYIVPDGEVGAQAFAVIREAIKREGMVALGRVVFTSREHIIALKPRGHGLIGLTLRYPYEIRKEDEYFAEIPDEQVTKEMLDLAGHIVQQKRGHFHPEKFKDQYEEALRDLLRKKEKGERIEAPKRREGGNVINLMDALRRSAGGKASTETRTRSRQRGSRPKAKKRAGATRHRKAG